MKYKWIIKWCDGVYESDIVSTEHEAIETINGYLKAFGNQIVWYGINIIR